MTTMHRAMPEATTLYAVAVVVVAGLVVWVGVVLATAKEPWGRPPPPPLPAADDLPIEPALSPAAAPAPALDADATAEATPVALKRSSPDDSPES
jgi:hypothetical protein